MSEGFYGAKIAVLNAGRVLCLQRDDIEGIPWPGWWDLPGGGREGAETPEQTALRELREELSVDLDLRWLVWRRLYPSARIEGFTDWFLVAEVAAPVEGIVLGDEGQDWRWFGIADFLSSPVVVPHFRDRLRHYLAERAARDPGYLL
ncbi:NUDIX hydrolase [Rhodobacteraceae bacterium ASV31]|nr:NUDIX hydrolase [Anianabacter salinae]